MGCGGDFWVQFGWSGREKKGIRQELEDNDEEVEGARVVVLEMRWKGNGFSLKNNMYRNRDSACMLMMVKISFVCGIVAKEDTFLLSKLKLIVVLWS